MGSYQQRKGDKSMKLNRIKTVITGTALAFIFLFGSVSFLGTTAQAQDRNRNWQRDRDDRRRDDSRDRDWERQRNERAREIQRREWELRRQQERNRYVYRNPLPWYVPRGNNGGYGGRNGGY